MSKTQLNVGFIGSGKIAHFHADTLKYFNINIQSLSYRSNEENANSFAKKYDIKEVYSDWRKMIKDTNLDFLWIVPSWDQIDIMIDSIISSGLPAFFEKPISLSSDKLKRVINKYSSDQLNHFQVGYNRRFYNIINDLKDYLSKEKIIAIAVDLPEPAKGLDNKLLQYRLIQNAAHLYDTILYICGYENVKIKNIQKISYKNLHDNHLLLLEINGIPINITSIWNSPQNYSVKIYTESEKLYILSPFEVLTVYQGFDVIEPTKEIPIRRYLPKKKLTLFEQAQMFKPGFEQQTKYFIEKTFIGLNNGNAHSLNDSFILLDLLEKIKNP